MTDTPAEPATEPPAPGTSPVPVIPAIAIYLASFQILTAGILMSTVPYDSPTFARSFIPVEAAVAITMLLGTWLFFRPAVIGLRMPRIENWKYLAPMGVMLLVGLIVWIARWASVPEGAERDMALTLGSFVATFMIGFTEEWMYRGLVLVLLVHWLGPRKGGLLSLALFGLVHAMNIVGGLAWWVALIQVPSAALSGAVFLLAALGTRSILLPILGHALWDFFLVDGGQAASLGGESLAVGWVIPMPLLMGSVSLFLLRGLMRPKPFAD